MARQLTRPAGTVAAGLVIDRLRRRRVFDDDAVGYDAARPTYPDRVYVRLVDGCGLRPGSKVLEVGPGTGQATIRLAELGGQVTAIELGPSLASRLAERTAHLPVDVVVGDFDRIRLDPASFDLAVCANAYHWLDPDTAAARLGRVLRPGGWLALWWNSTYTAEPSLLADALEPVYRTFLPSDVAAARPGLPHALDWSARAAELGRCGHFRPVSVELIRWEATHTTAEVRRLFATYSDVRSLPQPRRAAMLDAIESVVRDRFGGAVTRAYVTALYLAQRR